MKQRKLIAGLLSIIMLLTTFTPISATADPTITVGTVTDVAGATVDVDVVLENNPGILGAILTISYDDGLTLVDAKSGEAFSGHDMTKSGELKSPCRFSWDAVAIDSVVVKDGTILTLKFKIPQDAEAGHKYAVEASYIKGDITDNQLNDIDVNIVNGSVSVVDYIPGDLNSDRTVDVRDVIFLRRDIVGGYNQIVNRLAGDVNADATRNTKDVILIRRFITGGYGVTLFPGKSECEHTLSKIDALKSTCTEFGNTEYWYCDLCDTAFEDNKGMTAIMLGDTVIEPLGHTLVIDEAVEPTYETTGLTEGSHCSVCGHIEIAQEVIPQLIREEYEIQYNYDMVPQNMDSLKEKDTYKPSQGKVLERPILDKYKFLGWSDKEGNMYGMELPKGTTGDLILYANWASDRNRAVPKKNIGEPIICEDSEDGLILFVYEIGEIVNVPIFEKYNILSANGLITKGTRKEQKTIQKGNAETIGKSIANTTTNSTTWTLSEDWSETTSVSEEWAQQQGMTVEEAEAYCKSNTNAYNMTNSSGGSLNIVNSDNSSYRITAGKAHEESTYNEEQKYAKFNIDGKLSNSTTVSGELSAGINAGLKFPLKLAEASVGANVGAKVGLSNTTAWEIGAGYEQSKFTKDITTGTDSWSQNIDVANAKSTTVNSTKTWNSSEGFTASQQTSSESSIAKSVSELISKKYVNDTSYTTGGTKGEAQEYSSSNAKEDSYSSSVTYSEEEIISNEITIETTANVHGSYRIVHTGTAKVFAVVGYDIKNKAYFTYTHSVLDDDEYKEYLDYSFDGTFNDYETSVLPFEIPGFVNDYVNSRIITSKLQINDDGIVTKYLGEKDDEIVLIPSYYTRTNATTGEIEMLKIKGIAPGLFKGNTNIVGVSLGNFVNEIPESAFEGCTSLKEIICPNVVSIGANAFKGCSKLSEFALPNEIETIGDDAFDGTNAIKATAPTKEIAKAVASSDVQNITLDISKIDAADFSDMAFEIGEINTFKLLGGYKEYKGLTINSDAKTTIISGVTLSECGDTPIELSSSNVTLERVTAQADGFALVLKADETTLSIEGVSSMLSESENSIIAKTINLIQINEETYSEIEANGNVLVCGEVNNNDDYINEEKIVIITEDEYINHLTSRKVTFDANGGTVAEESITVPYNGTISEFPAARRDYYTFEGWFTEADGGEKVTEDTTIIADITLYAHWKHNDAVWALKSDVPADAEIVNTEYRYRLTSYTTSSSSILTGWIPYKESSDWGPWGEWSNWQDDVIYGDGGNFVEVKTKEVTTGYEKKTQWFYSRYYGHNGNYYVAVAYSSGICTKYEDTGWLDYSLPKETTHYFGGKGYPAYGKGKINSKAIYWYNEQTRQVDDYNRPIKKTQYSSRTRELIYTYYFFNEKDKVSSTYPVAPNSNSKVSNIQEWVQYRTK